MTRKTKKPTPETETETENDLETEADLETETENDLETDLETEDETEDEDETETETAPHSPGMVTRRTAILMTAAGVAGGAGLGVLGTYLTQRNRARPPRKPMLPAYVPLAEHSPSKGPAPAKVTVVEFSDFQCPYCGRGNKVVTELLEKHPEVRLVMRHNPLPFHPQAKPAAFAMQAALRQDAAKAWALHDLMFANRQALSDGDLEGYAKQVGLDVAAFNEVRASDAVKKEVDLDQALAKKVGANGTPTFFVNGVPVRGAQPIDKFTDVVAKELEEAQKLLDGGAALADVYEKRSKDHVAKKA